MPNPDYIFLFYFKLSLLIDLLLLFIQQQTNKSFNTMNMTCNEIREPILYSEQDVSEYEEDMCLKS